MLPLPLQSCDLWMFVKENSDRKRNFFILQGRNFLLQQVFVSFVSFSIRVFFTDTDDSQDSRGMEQTIFYSTLPLPPAHEHWDIYLQLCMWDDYPEFLIATLVFTRCLLQRFDMETGGFELGSPLYYKRTG